MRPSLCRAAPMNSTNTLLCNPSGKYLEKEDFEEAFKGCLVAPTPEAVGASA